MGLKNPSELATHQLTGFFYPRGFPKMFQILVEESMPPIGQLEYFQPSPSSQAQARTETDTWHCDICSRGNIARCQHWSSWTEKSSSDRICSFLGVQPAGNRGEKSHQVNEVSRKYSCLLTVIPKAGIQSRTLDHSFNPQTSEILMHLSSLLNQEELWRIDVGSSFCP